MKKALSLLLLLFVTNSMIAQSLNSYKYVIVPVKFEWQKTDNQYRLSTMTKSLLTNAGFTVFYDNEILPAGVGNDRCDKLYADVQDVSSLLVVKALVVLKDCNNKEVFRSKTGSSKDKNFESAYHESLREAFQSLSEANYRYDGNVSGYQVKFDSNPTVKAQIIESVPAKGLIVEAVATGYLIIDYTTSNIALRLYRTTAPDLYIATSKGRNGVARKAGDEIVFEFYEGDALRSERFAVKL